MDDAGNTEMDPSPSATVTDDPLPDGQGGAADPPNSGGGSGGTEAGPGAGGQSTGGNGGTTETRDAPSGGTGNEPKPLPPAPMATLEEALENCRKSCAAQTEQGCDLFGTEACVSFCELVLAAAPPACRDRLNATTLCQLEKDACNQDPCADEFAAQAADCN